MSFQVHALPADAFAPLFELDDAALAARGGVRRRVDAKPGFPCRVSLDDAEVGEEVILLNFEHQPAQSPFRARHAIYVRRGAGTAAPAADETPAMLRHRTLSLRAFDADGMITGAEVVLGAAMEEAVSRLFADPRAAYLHAHSAAMGCYLARIDRA